MTNLDVVQNFSFIKWVEDTYPCDDDTEKKDELYNLFSEALSTSAVFATTKETFKCTLDVISTLCVGEPDVEPVAKLCEGLDHLRDSWLRTPIQDKFMEVYNGYFLNVSSLPFAVLFWKHLVSNGILPKNRRMTRVSFENEFNLYSGRNGTTKFSHVLFALSWLNILRVYNNATILFNAKGQIAF